MRLLVLEDQRIVNLDLVSIVEMDHRKKTATIWDSGVRTHSDSHILYRYYAAQEKIQLPPEEEEIQVGRTEA
jgi:hypothetical protein